MEFYRWKIEKYRKATRHLTTFQHGIYRLLIDEYMETREPLPDNDAALGNIAHISPEQWAANSAVIRAFFKAKGGMLFHDYCDDELDYQDKNSKFRSEKASKAAKKRWAKNNDLDATSILQASPEQCLAMPDKRQEIEDKKERTPYSPPEGFSEFWEMYPRQRRGSKDKAERAYLRALERATKEQINEGTRRYSSSDEVARGFAKGAEAWLNDDRWGFDYRAPQSGKPSHAGAAYGDSLARANEAAKSYLDREDEIRAEADRRPVV